METPPISRASAADLIAEVHVLRQLVECMFITLSRQQKEAAEQSFAVLCEELTATALARSSDETIAAIERAQSAQRRRLEAVLHSVLPPA